MSQVELDEFFQKLAICYPKFDVANAIDMWSEVLCQYSAAEVNEMFEFYASRESYKDIVPQVYTIVKNLTRISDKVDFKKQIIPCKYCRKYFNDIEKLHTHEDRCSAIAYLERQYKKLNLGIIDNAKKAELYNMQENEFNEKYKKTLRYIQQLITSEYEKQLIENVFEPPNVVEAKAFLNR